PSDLSPPAAVPNVPSPSISTVWPRSSAPRTILRIRSVWVTAFFQGGLPVFRARAAPPVFPVGVSSQCAGRVPRSDPAQPPSAGRPPSPAPASVLITPELRSRHAPV